MTNSIFEYLFRNSLRSENEKKVIIMLHGYGSNEYDLFSLSENINSNYLIISIRARHRPSASPAEIGQVYRREER